MTGRLLHRPKPIGGESFEGYLLRVAEANGYASGRWVTDLAGIENRVSCVAGDVAGLANRLGHDAADLDAMRYLPSPWAGKRRINLFNGRPVNRMAINLDRPRVCLACLKDSAHLRMAWELAPTAICPDHGAILLDACPSCGKAISWNRSHVCLCHHCGFDFREAEASSAPVNAVRLTRLLLSKAGLAEDGGEGFPAEVRSLPLTDLIQLTLLLGSAGIGLPSGAGHWPCARLSAAEMAGLVDAAATVLADWPDAFHALLDKRREGAAPGRTGLEGDFGRFYAALYRDLRGPNLDFVRTALEHYAAGRWAGGVLTRRNRRFHEANQRSSRFASRAEASRHLRVRPETVDDLLNAGILDGIVHRAGSRRATLIDRAAMTERLTGLIELQEVCRLLRISKAPVKDLIAAGHLKPVALSTRRAPRIRYRRAEVEELLTAILGAAPVQADRGGHISLAGTLRRLSFHHLGLADLVGEILAGVVTVRALLDGKQGLAACLFDEGEILAVVNRHKVARGDALTIPEAAERLQLKQQVAYQLVKAGLWPVTRAWESGRAIRLVPAEALAEFKRDCIAAAELAHSIGTSPRSLVEALEAQGVKPITGPGVDDGRQYFFARVPAEHAVARTVFPLGEAARF